MDRKFTELEKKTKTTGATGARGTATTARTGASSTRGAAVGKSGINSSTTTPRGSSRATT